MLTSKRVGVPFGIEFFMTLGVIFSGNLVEGNRTFLGNFSTGTDSKSQKAFGMVYTLDNNNMISIDKFELIDGPFAAAFFLVGKNDEPHVKDKKLEYPHGMADVVLKTNDGSKNETINLTLPNGYTLNDGIKYLSVFEFESKTDLGSIKFGPESSQQMLTSFSWITFTAIMIVQNMLLSIF